MEDTSQMLDRITRMFSESIDTIIQMADILPPFISDAAGMMVNALVNERKILVCGNGSGASDSQDFTSKLMVRYASERPSLPAISLSVDTSILTFVSEDSHYNEVFSRQIKALGQADDILLVIVSDRASPSLLKAIQAAHSREMHVMVLCNEDEEEMSRLLQPDDMELKIPSRSPARTQEMQRLILHCLCELIDEHLFGIQE